ncbi:MAG: DNA-3-methyladenine glycosylase [Nanoarchaeota archaeon]
MDKEILLPKEFYDQKTEEVAIGLLGKILVRKVDGKKLRGKIVEVEAYLGEHDKAAHAAAGKTERTNVLYGSSGLSYIFRLRAYYCLNVVAEPQDSPGCVLIRALEPLNHHDYLRNNRGKGKDSKIEELCSGPGKLCQAFKIDLAQYNVDLRSLESELYIIEPEGITPFDVMVTKRIGIKKHADWQQRYTIAGNAHVSGDKKANLGKILKR